MKQTTTHNTAELSTNLLRRLALMQHLGEDFFSTDDNCAYAGTLQDAKDTFEHECGSMEFETSTDDDFNVWCSNNLTEIEELDIEDCYDVDYYVLTDEEADKKAGEYIKDSLWAFNAAFLSSETGINYEVFKAIQDNGKCESNNDAIESCIDDMEGFIEAAIRADGRGHFLSSYDGNEDEETVEIMDEETREPKTTFYIYRIN